jgi:UDP-N-acetylglucosamine--N-acetylmuramyl-(pentapeptide) pyrophosphoryl-undecaprenol N-acetylglucosamine transferase
MRIMITGGGTGGHTSPAVAIIEELRKRDPRLMIQWVGRKGGIEEQVCERVGVPFRSVPVEGWPRKRSLRQAWVAGKLALGVARSMLYVATFRPQVVVGVGGYVSIPLCYAAQRLSVPTVLHEQNKRLGMANRLLAARATRLLLSYPDTLGDYPRDKSRVVGNPVRAGFAHPPEKTAARQALGLDPNVPVVLVSGGSQGARTINSAMTEAITQFGCEEVQFIWMTGHSDAHGARDAAGKAPCRVEVFPFINDMAAACAAADFVVGRAGASSTAEIAMLGKPSLLVPYPFATDNHQEQNARAFEQAGAAIILLDEECTGARLADALKSVLRDPVRLQQMSRSAASLARPGAAEAIVEEILLLAFTKSGTDYELR